MIAKLILLLGLTAICNAVKLDLTGLDTYQSNTAKGPDGTELVASNAADGDAATCSLTRPGWYSWWVIDMGEEKHVNYVTVTAKSGYETVIDTFIVGLYSGDEAVPPPDAFSFEACGQDIGFGQSVRTVVCMPDTAPGRYLIIQLPSLLHPLGICEVEIDVEEE